MQSEKCSHIWEMVNVSDGLIVMKKCFHCNKVSTCFAFHHESPLEACREGDHFWNFVESDESFHFDLKCSKCETLVKFDESVGLMICTGCDEACEVDVLKRELEPEKALVCIAVGRRPIEERKQLSDEKFAVLEEFFNQRSKASKCKIKIVPHKMVRDITKCYADVIKDMDTLFTE